LKKILLTLLTFVFANCNSQNKFDLEKVMKMEREDLIVMEIDNYLNKKSNYGEEMGKLNSSQKTLVIIGNLEREINNGGFNQFYWNSSGNYANETVESLKKIGAEKLAEIVNKANSEFPNGIVPKKREKRIKILNLIQEKSAENWNELDFKFYRPNEKTGKMEIENTSILLIEFIKANKPDFEK
jgi:hypothetical protein